MTLLDAYLSCLVHDLKKVLLCGKRHGRPEGLEYAHWGSRRLHSTLNELDTQVDTKDAGLPRKLRFHRTYTRRRDIWRMAALHHNEDPEGEAEPRTGLDTLAIYAIQTADKAHKQLYWPGEQRPSPDIGIGLQFPCSYPFYGVPRYWRPEDTLPDEFERLLGLPEGAQWANSTDWFRDHLVAEVRERVKADGMLTPRSALRLLSEHCAGFPESTYLPITSLNFHSRLAGALFLVFYKAFQGVKIPESSPAKVTVPLRLTTITTPAEVLRNRLRDVRHLRKVSHRLLLAVHGLLHELYLGGIDDTLFAHPDSNPFLFYSKDALVLLHGGGDKEFACLLDACGTVADESGVAFGVSTQKVTVEVKLRISGQVLTEEVGKPLSELDPNRTRAPSRQGDLSVIVSNPVRDSIAPAVVLCEADKEAPNSCTTCGKPGEFEEDDRGDRPYDTCQALRENFRFCDVCRLYVKSDRCAACGGTTRMPPSPLLLTEQDEGAANRVAYVMIATNCRPDRGALRAEAESLMARYRIDRLPFEQPLAQYRAGQERDKPGRDEGPELDFIRLKEHSTPLRSSVAAVRE